MSRRNKTRRDSPDSSKSTGMKALGLARNLFSRRGKSRKSRKASRKRVQSRMAPTVAAVFRQSLMVQRHAVICCSKRWHGSLTGVRDAVMARLFCEINSQFRIN